MVVSSIAKAGGYTDQKGNYIKVWSNWKTVASQTVSNTDRFPVDNRLVLKDWTTYGTKWDPASGSKTVTSFDSSGNQIWQTTQNYWGGTSAQRSSVVTPTAPTYSKRNIDWTNYSLDTQWFEENERKRKQALGIVDITQSVQNGVEWSPKFFDQWEYQDNAKQAIDKLQNQTWENTWQVWDAERMARQKQQAADKAIQDELQWLNRDWQIFDRWNEDLLSQKDRGQEKMDIDVERAKEDRQFQLDEYRKNVNRNIEDTGKQRDETMQTIRRQWAALWLNVVSTFQQSYKNTQDKFNNVINRMQEDLSTQEGRSTLEDQRLDADYSRATKQLLQDYEKESTRLKQDFEYSTRDYRENLILDANKLVEQYGLSSDKLWARLQELSLDAFNKVETAYWSYLDNSQKQVDLLDSQVNNVLDTRNKYLTQQKTYADNFLAWSQNMTIQDLNAMVRDGQISEQMAQQTLWQVVQMALDTIDTATVDGVWVQFQDQIIEAINAWMTPMQAIQQVMASEEFAPVVAKMQEMWLSSYQKALAQLQIQQGRLGLQQGQQWLQEWLLDIQKKQAELDALNGTGWGWQIDLGETPIDTWIKSVYWNNVKLAPTVAVMIQNAQKNLQAQGIDLKIADSYRSTETQANAYNSWKAGVAPPWHSRHEKWQAIDLSQATKDWMKNEKVFQALRDAWLQQLPWERWHWSYGEMWWTGNTSWSEPTASELAMFDKWAQYIGQKWGLTQARFNQIAEYQKANKDTSIESSPYLQAFNLLSFDKPTLAEQEQAKIEWMIKSGDMKWAKTKLEWLAKVWLDTTARNDYDATRTMISSLDKVQKTLDALNAKWVKTSLLKGKYEDIANKFGTQSDPEIAKLWVTLKDQLDAIRRARSWAALTDSEEEFYNSIFPSNQDNYDLNISKVSGLRDSRKMIFDTYLEQAYWNDLVQEIRYWANQSTPTASSTNNNVNRINQLRVSVPLANSPLSSKFD